MAPEPRRRTALLVAAIGAGALIALCLLLLRATDKAAGDEGPQGGGPPALLAHFSVLGEATPERLEALSPGARALLAGPGSPVEALGEAHYGEADALVAVANGSLCAIDESSGGGGLCGGPEEALEGQLISAGFCLPGLPEGQARLFGLMPDGVSTVRIEGAGHSEEVPVIDNVYIAEVPAESTVISAVGGSEGEGIEVELPLAEAAAASGTCAQR